MDKEKVLALVTNKAKMKAFKSIMGVLPSTPGPLTFVGSGSTAKLCAHIAGLNVSKILIVTDKPLVDLGIVANATDVLEEKGLEVIMFDGVKPDPTLDLIEDGLALQMKHSCDAILAIGGGSSIDAAKTIAAAATNGGKSKNVIGYYKVKKAPIPLFAIPTTSGTGSEVTFGAVVSDAVTHEKFFIADPKVTPKAIALDPCLITGLPPSITAATGMDALTHAIEAWISAWANPNSDSYAKQSIQMLFKYLPVAYAEGSNLEAREQVSVAAYYAGIAINTGAVGYVHAVAHQFGAWYSTPHGWANAVVLPEVLRFSKDKIEGRLAELADMLSLSLPSDSVGTKADKFIEAVVQLNVSFGIGTTLEAIKASDVSAIATRAVKEGSGMPVPKMMDQNECETLIRALMV
jgi:alcohol dehydrogenase class IV